MSLSFWQRLLFPKTAQLLDQSESLRAKDAMIQALVDAVVRGRGEVGLFEKPALPSGQPVRTSNAYSTDQSAWLLNEKLKEDERIVSEAVMDEDAYADLYVLAQNGQAGARELLEEVERRLQMSVLVEERLAGEGVVQ
jgi:hypothetical protein